LENSSDPDDLQAWCGACEKMFVREKEMTPAFRAFTDMCIVCDGCYAQLKQLHSAPNLPTQNASLPMTAPALKRGREGRADRIVW
jgi:hypothetical protein